MRETQNTDPISKTPSIGNDIDIFIPGVAEDEYSVVSLQDPCTLKLMISCNRCGLQPHYFQQLHLIPPPTPFLNIRICRISYNFKERTF